MAVCEIWDVRGRLDSPLRYAANPDKTGNPKYTEAEWQSLSDVMKYATNGDKTEQQFFVSGVNCDPSIAREEMQIVKRQFQDESEIVCYHGFQSFREGEVTPEQAHEIGVKLAKKMWGDRFQVIVATHLNTGCLHNHFVLNSVSFTDGKHYHDNKANLKLLRQYSDELCREYALSVIEHPVGRKKPYVICQAEKNGLPTRDSVARQAIDEAISKSYTMRDFAGQMKAMGYRVNFDPHHKYWTIQGEGWKRPKRLYRLGEDYTNIKTNTGSKTAGTDHLTIDAIGKLTAEQVVEKIRYIAAGSPHGYRPKPVRRKDIPKPYDPGKTRPLGIPCIWDRLIQQCIKQVMEPICEAKFSDYSYGFRPNRSAEHAIAKTYQHIQRSHLHFVVEFDIKGFFDKVNHRKLIQQIWAMGIHDTHLIYVLRKILQAPIKMPDGKIVMPQCGTPQGGIISPLLANIVLNELDHWIESQWMENPVCQKYSRPQGSVINRGGGYKNMRKTGLKEMYIVRYADDFRIFCRTRNEAKRTKIAVTQWLSERLKLEVSPEKTRVVNVKRQCAEFLGFKIKAVQWLS